MTDTAHLATPAALAGIAPLATATADTADGTFVVRVFPGVSRHPNGITEVVTLDGEPAREPMGTTLEDDETAQDWADRIAASYLRTRGPAADPNTPVIVDGDPEPFTGQDFLNLLLAEARGDEHTAATLRWKRNNATDPRICHCDAPGTVRVRATGGGHVGDIPPTWWRCAEHAAIPLNVAWCNGVPQTGQAR